MRWVSRRSRLGRCGSRLLAVVALALALGACGGEDGTPTDVNGPSGPSGPTAAPTASGPRPASTATLAIVSPAEGLVVEGTTVDLEISLEGARVVPATTTDIVPDEGHLHVILDDQLVSMTSGLNEAISDLTPGRHLLKVEFVASDHAPFDPRVVAAVSFEVAG